MKYSSIIRLAILSISFLLINKVDTIFVLFIWEFLLLSYLASIIKSKYSFLLLIHPIFLLTTFWAFEIPFTEIGIGFSFIGKFERFFNTENENNSELATVFFSGSIFQTYSNLYLSSVPVISIKLLFEKFPDIGFYIWLNIFHLFSITLAAIHLYKFKSMSEKGILLIILFCIISPSFLEINAGLHRYSLLFTGLIITFNSINYYFTSAQVNNKISLFVTLLFGIALILISKPALIMSVFLYLIFVACKKMKININLFFFLIAFIFVTDIFGLGVLKQIGNFTRYEEINQTGGSSFSFLATLFGIGIFFRILYAALSPFPWINFSQGLDLYGNNFAFLFIHIFSAITSLYLILSFFVNIKNIKIDKGNDNAIIFGFLLMLTLRFSAIGFHVYLIPALPFLAPLLLSKQYRIPLVLVVSIISALEISLFIFKLI